MYQITAASSVSSVVVQFIVNTFHVAKVVPSLMHSLHIVWLHAEGARWLCNILVSTAIRASGKIGGAFLYTRIFTSRLSSVVKKRQHNNICNRTIYTAFISSNCDESRYGNRGSCTRLWMSIFAWSPPVHCFNGGAKFQWKLLSTADCYGY